MKGGSKMLSDNRSTNRRFIQYVQLKQCQIICKPIACSVCDGRSWWRFEACYTCCNVFNHIIIIYFEWTVFDEFTIILHS